MGYAQDLVSKGYGGYAGWGDNEAQADFQATGGSGKYTSGNSSSSGYNIPDPLEQAKKLQQFTVEANQPVIQALQASKQPLEQRYQDLITSIKGNQKTAENRQTVATNAELGRRGIVGGGLYDQEMTNALNPITQQYTDLLSQANAGQSQDLNQIALQIAQLQGGSPASAIQNALQLSGIQNQANQFQQQLALQQQQQQFNQKYVPIPGLGIYDVSNKNLLGGYSQSGVSPSGNQIIGVY